MIKTNKSFFFSYRKRFHIDVEPLIEQLVDKSKVEESMFKASESQKQVREFLILVLRVE